MPASLHSPLSPKCLCLFQISNEMKQYSFKIKDAITYTLKRQSYNGMQIQLMKLQ